MQRFDVAAANGPASPASPASPAATNGVKTEPDGDKPHKATNGKRPSPATDSSSASSPRPTKKQHRSQPSMEDLDAAYAARLQAEENGRARTTRGGAKGVGSGSGKKGASPAKAKGAKKRKSKSKAKVESGDESDADGERKEEKERKGGFHVRCLECLFYADGGRNRCCCRRRSRSCWASKRYVFLLWRRL
jgi:upstream activation factor subunit UAF30